MGRIKNLSLDEVSFGSYEVFIVRVNKQLQYSTFIYANIITLGFHDGKKG